MLCGIWWCTRGVGGTLRYGTSLTRSFLEAAKNSLNSFTDVVQLVHITPPNTSPPPLLLSSSPLTVLSSSFSSSSSCFSPSSLSSKGFSLLVLHSLFYMDTDRERRRLHGRAGKNASNHSTVLKEGRRTKRRRRVEGSHFFGFVWRRRRTRCLQSMAWNLHGLLFFLRLPLTFSIDSGQDEVAGCKISSHK